MKRVSMVVKASAVRLVPSMTLEAYDCSSNAYFSGNGIESSNVVNAASAPEGLLNVDDADVDATVGAERVGSTKWRRVCRRTGGTAARPDDGHGSSDWVSTMKRRKNRNVDAIRPSVRRDATGIGD